MEKVKSNKKLIIALFSFSIVLLAAIAVIVAIWAASTQSIISGFDISYSVGDNVAAAVRTEYYIPNSGEDATTITTDKDGNEVENKNGYVIFNAPDERSTKGIYIGDFNLTPSTPQIEFYFTIENLRDDSYVQVIVDREYTAKNNINIKTYYYNTDTFISTDSASTIASTNWKTNAHTTNVAQEGFKMIKVVLSVEDTNRLANCAGSIMFTFMDSANEKDIASLNKDSISTMLQSSTATGGIIFDNFYNDDTYPSTGTDLSENGDGSIWGCAIDDYVYILSKSTISLPTDSTGILQKP